MDDPSPSLSKASRNRPRTEGRLRKAVEDILVELGFEALTPSAVLPPKGGESLAIVVFAR